MDGEKRNKREYARFLFLWVTFLASGFLSFEFGILGYIALTIFCFGSLFLIATLIPLFRSRKAIATFEKIGGVIEAFVEEAEAVAEAKEMVDDPRREDIHSHPSKYSDTYYRLQRCADKHNKEAKRIEGLMDKLEG